MSEDRRKTAIILGAIAGAAGLAIGAWLLSRRVAERSGDDVEKTVADVLTDCYSKMREIQSHLSDLAPVLGAPIPDSV